MSFVGTSVWLAPLNAVRRSLPGSPPPGDPPPGDRPDVEGSGAVGELLDADRGVAVTPVREQLRTGRERVVARVDGRGRQPCHAPHPGVVRLGDSPEGSR